MKELLMKYCEVNEKYDLLIDGVLVGKHDNLMEAITHATREVIRNE